MSSPVHLRWRSLSIVAIMSVALFVPAAASGATPITVAQAIGQQNGAVATVRGYVVGQPTATNTVVRSNFPNDYALALADTAGETSTSRMISTNSRLSYDQVWNALKVTDQDPGNSANVILLYSGRSQSKSSNGGNPDDWNREHVWAKSHGDFGTATGPGTDLHHLRPEDVSVNADRGNKDFDMGGSAVNQAPRNYTDADSFEPRNAVKGDVARMIFYMAVRYDGGDGFADLEMNNSVNNGSRPNIGRLSVLLQWHTQDPPDAFEKRRNQVIFDSYQHNRNPFIDHPEWAAQIWN